MINKLTTLLMKYDDALYLNFDILQYSPAGIYMFKVNNRNTKTRFSMLTIKPPERRQWRRSGVFIINFGNNSHLVLVFLLLNAGSEGELGLIVS